MMKKNKGITLVALVVTIIVLLILAGVTIAQLTGNGLFEKTKQAKEEAQKAEATEMMNLKITNLQIWSYAENTRMPTLQELADGLCEDKNDEIEYVELTSQATAALDKIVVGNNTSIYTKLRKYPYEFEIDGSLRLASIDGVKIADSSSSISSEQFEALKALVVQNQETISQLQTELQTSKEKIEILENSGMENLRVNLMSTPVSIPMSTTYTDRNIDIKLSDSIENYKFLEIQTDVVESDGDIAYNKINYISKELLNYNNTNTINWNNDSFFNFELINWGPNSWNSITAWFKDKTTLHIGQTHASSSNYSYARITNIYGIK